VIDGKGGAVGPDPELNASAQCLSLVYVPWRFKFFGSGVRAFAFRAANR